MKADIIIPVFNTNLEHLKFSIDSCNGQGDITVVIDGCNKDYSDVLSKYDINVICLKENCGPGKARNIAIQSTKNEIVSFLDSDDIMLDKIPNAINVFTSNKDIDLICGNYKKFDNNKIGKPFYRVKQNLNYRSLINQNYIALGTVSVRRSAINKVIDSRGYFFDERFYIAEDYAAWLGIAEVGLVEKKNNIFFDINPLYMYRVYDSSLYSQNKDKESQILSTIRFESKKRVGYNEEERKYPRRVSGKR